MRQFTEFEGGRMADNRPDFFYKKIAGLFMHSLTDEIPFTYFDLRTYEKPLRNADKADDNALIALYIVLSPEHQQPLFQVLAKRHDERNDDVRAAFRQVPYLNSSLFEPTEMEHNALFISNLRDDKSIPAFAQTVLKDEQGKRRSGSLNTPQYLFAFLDAYDFGAEGSEDIQEDNKTLINASVLGLIFEKINGYKDGSFFTPGFITMYMCRETIRRLAFPVLAPGSRIPNLPQRSGLASRFSNGFASSCQSQSLFRNSARPNP